MPQPSLQQLTRRLRQGDRRVTGPRQVILDQLREQAHPRTIREIHAALPSLCNLATVYRAMHLLVTMDMVKRFDFGDGTARFELVGEGEDGHHHHLICRQCSNVVEIDECFPSALEKKIARQNGFARLTHTLEFFGVCPECQ
jgi:Fur family ferric uptake transcriptional regulator